MEGKRQGSVSRFAGQNGGFVLICIDSFPEMVRGGEGFKRPAPSHGRFEGDIKIMIDAQVNERKLSPRTFPLMGRDAKGKGGKKTVRAARKATIRYGGFVRCEMEGLSDIRGNE